MAERKYVLFSLVISVVWGISDTQAEFGFSKKKKKKAAAATSLVFPELSFKVQGAPTNKVEAVFFYVEACQKLTAAANGSLEEAIIAMAKIAGLKQSAATVEERLKALDESVEMLKKSELNEEQKKQVQKTWSQVLSAQILGLASYKASQALVVTAKGVPDEVKANKVAYGFKGMKYIKNAPKAIKSLMATVKDYPSYVKLNGGVLKKMKEIGSAKKIEKPSIAEQKTLARKDASEAIGSEVEAEGEFG